jgi:UPF0755 protein
MATRFTRNLRNPETGKFSGREIWLRVRSMMAVCLAVAVLGAGGYFVYDWAKGKWQEFQTADDYDGTTSAAAGEVEIIIPEESLGSDIGAILVENDVVKTSKAWLSECEKNTDCKKIQPGKWLLPRQVSAKVALNMLLDRSNMVLDRVTLREGLWLTDYAKTLAKATELKEKDFTKAFKDVKNIGLPEWALKEKNLENAEGFIFPETYDIPPQVTATSMVKVATAQFTKITDGLNIEERAEEMGFTPYQILTVASIIESEVNKDADRPKVARVIYNRLEDDWLLGMDTTVAYALGERGRYEFTEKELAVDSPYNTRKYKGLPPGPICNPGKMSIEAALNPADGDWMYFLITAPGSGDTVFVETEKEFNKAKAEYKEWCNASDENYKVCYGEER